MTYVRTLNQVLVLLAMTVAAAWGAGAPETPDPGEPNPISIPGQPWAFDGFTITVPTDPGWYSTAKDGHYADLSKDYASAKAALVVETRKLEADVAGEQALLKLLQSEHAAIPDSGMKLLTYDAQAFAPKGALCARFSVDFEDARGNASMPAVLAVRGVGCVRPDAPRVVVTLRYAQRREVAEMLPELRQVGESFLESLRFLSSSSQQIYQARVAVRGDHPEQALELLRPLAEQGDVEAALFLGNIYLYGRGAEPDYTLARQWLEHAARAGRSEALYNLGAMYDKGIGTARDVNEAIRLFTLAADQRDAQAQLNLALLYLNGDGVKKDVPQAEAWLQRAAGNGNKRAEGILSVGKYRQ